MDNHTRWIKPIFSYNTPQKWYWILLMFFGYTESIFARTSVCKKFPILGPSQLPMT